MLPLPPVPLGPPCRRPILIATKYLVFRGQDTRIVGVLRPWAFFGWYERNFRLLLSPFISFHSADRLDPEDEEDWDRTLVSCPRNTRYFAGGQLAVFQGASEAPRSESYGSSEQRGKTANWPRPKGLR